MTGLAGVAPAHEHLAGGVELRERGADVGAAGELVEMALEGLQRLVDVHLGPGPGDADRDHVGLVLAERLHGERVGEQRVPAQAVSVAAHVFAGPGQADLAADLEPVPGRDREADAGPLGALGRDRLGDADSEQPCVVLGPPLEWSELATVRAAEVEHRQPGAVRLRYHVRSPNAAGEREDHRGRLDFAARVPPREHVAVADRTGGPAVLDPVGGEREHREPAALGDVARVRVDAGSPALVERRRRCDVATYAPRRASEQIRIERADGPAVNSRDQGRVERAQSSVAAAGDLQDRHQAA